MQFPPYSSFSLFLNLVASLLVHRSLITDSPWNVGLMPRKFYFLSVNDTAPLLIDFHRLRICAACEIEHGCIKNVFLTDQNYIKMSGPHGTLCNLCWAIQHRVKQNRTNSPRWILVYSTLNKPLIFPHKFFLHSYSKFHQANPTKILFFVSHRNRLNMEKFLKANLSLRPGDFLAWALEGQCISDFISYQAALWKWRSPWWNQE